MAAFGLRHSGTWGVGRGVWKGIGRGVQEGCAVEVFCKRSVQECVAGLLGWGVRDVRGICRGVQERSVGVCRKGVL